MDLSDDKLLIDNTGIISSQALTKPLPEWNLADWIEDMKSWPNLKVKTYGEQALNQKFNNLYNPLSFCLRYHLLHQRELELSVYHEQRFIEITPHVNLVLACHDFLARSCWPRIGCKWKWLAGNADCFWGVFEASLVAHLLKKIRVGKNANTKPKLLIQLELLTGKELERLKNAQDKQFTSQVNNTNSFERDIKKLYREAQKDLLPNIYKLILVDVEIHIADGDKSLIEPYWNYISAWDKYREDIKELPFFQVLNLPSLNDEPAYSGKSRK